MEFSARVIGNVKILELSGSFDTYNTQVANDWLQAACAESPANIVINMKNVVFLDSMGLSVLVRSVKRSRENNGDVRLCGLNPNIRMVFELTRLNDLFEIYNAEEEAVEAFSQ